MRIALLGDIHLYRLLAMPWQLLGKRLMGQANLWLNRRYRFDRALLPPVIERVAAINPDLILCSGDLTTTSLAGEFADAAAALRPLADRFAMVVVPGNHDAYTFASARRKSFARAMSNLAPSLPHVRMLTERWNLLALNAAVPRMISSRGRIGRDQLDRAAAMIAGLTAADGLVVLCHYPTRIPTEYQRHSRWTHRLADAHRLDAMLDACPARIVYIHGHVHHPWHWQISPRRTHLNTGAPCLHTSDFPRGQGFWELELPSDPAQTLGLIRHERKIGVPDEAGEGAWVTIPEPPTA